MLRNSSFAGFLLVTLLSTSALAQTVGPNPIPSGGVPGGAAGGDLSGTYPNPTVVNGAHITNSSIPASGLVSPPTSVGLAAPGQVPGTATNDNAAAGKVGEYVEASIPSGSGVTVNVATTVASIVLTPGDWDIEANLTFAGTNAVVTYLLAGVSTTTNNISALVGVRVDASYGSPGIAIFASTVNQSLIVPRARVSISSPTTYYLVGQCGSTVSSPTGFGLINARRVR